MRAVRKSGPRGVPNLSYPHPVGKYDHRPFGFVLMARVVHLRMLGLSVVKDALGGKGYPAFGLTSGQPQS